MNGFIKLMLFKAKDGNSIIVMHATHFHKYHANVCPFL